jgi:hypothetical protein
MGGGLDGHRPAPARPKSPGYDAAAAGSAAASGGDQDDVPVRVVDHRRVGTDRLRGSPPAVVAGRGELLPLGVDRRVVPDEELHEDLVAVALGA